MERIKSDIGNTGNLLKKITAHKMRAIVAIACMVIVCLFLLAEDRISSRSTSEAEDGSEEAEPGTTLENSVPGEPANPVVHITMEIEINGLEQSINILEINPASGKVKIKPVLSYNRLFGFQLLSEMYGKHKAYAAVNGGFFYEYGDPSGMVVIDGEIITASTGKYPVFIFSNGKAELREMETRLWLKSDETSLELDDINAWRKGSGWIAFTRMYGTTNKGVDGKTRKGTTIVVKDNVITGIIEDSGEVEIPENGMLIVRMGNGGAVTGADRVEDSMPFSVGEKVELLYHPDLGDDGQAYECGSWIVKDGEIVIGEHDHWIGNLTNRDPRTALGIKENGEVVLLTVDGRQPGHSYGLTGRELGEFLLDYGVINAAMLDGGASTEMIVEGKIVNIPAHKGTERPLAGGIIVQVK
ncbi:MAG: phosphodiester glycosidase family protein [Clostridiaceae bacterium]|nr:phosphodiester glycosidase family protein [Clostridiaceae bacterium]